MEQEHATTAILNLETTLANAERFHTNPYWPELRAYLDIAYQRNLAVLGRLGCRELAAHYTNIWETTYTIHDWSRRQR